MNTYEVFIFGNGNIAVFHNDMQVVKLQKKTIQEVFIAYAKSKGFKGKFNFNKNFAPPGYHSKSKCDKCGVMYWTDSYHTCLTGE